MMKIEFEALAGYEVSVSDYDNIIEPMYMATQLSKAEFVKVICKERFALKSREEIRITPAYTGKSTLPFPCQMVYNCV